MADAQEPDDEAGGTPKPRSRRSTAADVAGTEALVGAGGLVAGVGAAPVGGSIDIAIKADHTTYALSVSPPVIPADPFVIEITSQADTTGAPIRDLAAFKFKKI